MINGFDATILVVDDDRDVVNILSQWLTLSGYRCFVANSGATALELMKDSQFDLVVSDIMMPGMSGVELLTRIKSSFPDVAVIMVTALDDRRTAIQTLEIGAYGYIIKPFKRNEILINVSNALERRRLTLLSRDYERSLELRVNQQTKEIRDREEEVIFRLISASGHHDDETGAHVRRIGLYAAEVARAYGWDTIQVDNIRLAAPMHDLGKIGVPDGILLKPGRLEPAELEVVKRHPKIGAVILAGSTVPLIRMAEEIAMSHHERWDGSGYPYGLKGEAIPESARIVAIVDVYDAMVHDRIYRPALPEEDVISMMAKSSREHFDPRIFDCFLNLLPKMRRIREDVREQDQLITPEEAS